MNPNADSIWFKHFIYTIGKLQKCNIVSFRGRQPKYNICHEYIQIQI